MSVLQTLKNNNFRFSKKYGQNFITDTNFLKSLVDAAGVDKDDEVLEIGTGAATLTKQIALKCKKLITYEIDKTLAETINENLKDLTNVKVVFKDALKTDISEIEQEFKGVYSIVANIPYYITTPLIFKFLEETSRIKSLSLMVQKEVAERMIAGKNDDNYGALSVMISFYGEATILKVVSKKMFKPMPKVDSAFIQIKINKKYDIDERYFGEFIKACFSNRRKTLINNLNMAYKIKKTALENLLEKDNICWTARAEDLDIQSFVKLAKQVRKLIK